MLIDVSRTALKHPTNISVNSFFLLVLLLLLFGRVKKDGRVCSAHKFLMYFGSLTRD